MRSTLLVLSLMAALAGTHPLQAQHPAAGTSAGAATGEDDCGMCHGTHDGRGNGSHSLRVDQFPALGTARNAGAHAMGRMSQTCLRCHATPSDRARQPQADRLQGFAIAGGKYLGLDLSDDHPLGRIERLGQRGPRPAWETARPYQNKGVATAAGLAEIDVLECSTCHDPHSRTSIIPSPSEQQALCGACHEPARYALAEHNSLACSDCHKLHAGYERSLLAEPFVDALCRSCHGRAAPAGKHLSEAALGAPQGHLDAPRENCLSCHSAHD